MIPNSEMEERMPSNIYFGPYNDPGDTHVLHHWEPNHDSDCHNPAIIVDRAPNSWTMNISIFLRNRPTTGPNDIVTPDDVSVKLYAAACGLFLAVPDVEDIVNRLLQGQGGVQPIKKWDVDHENAPAVPPYNLGLDTPWPSEPVPWNVPPYTSSLIVVATLQTVSGHQAPVGAVGTFTRDPCVAVWLG
jgi:hypothetical protein